TSGWITLLAMALVFGGAAVVITKLGGLFPGKALYDYSKEIAGTFVARAITVYYILYFIVIGVNLKIKLIDFLQENFLPKTPRYIILGVSVGLFGYVSHKGITCVARLFELYGTMFLITTVGLCLIAFPQGIAYNILPLYNPLEAGKLITAVPKLIFPFGGIEVLLVIPLTRANKKAPRVAFFTLMMIGLFYIMVVECTIMVLGLNNSALYNDALIEAIKIVQIPVLERPDIFYLTVGLTSLFAGMVMVYVALLEHVGKLLPKVSRVKLVVSAGILLYGIGMLMMNVDDIGSILDRIVVLPLLISGFLIPGALLIAAKIKLKAKGRL
ncbi:MAG TPA: GerAB/ArcD/ProY family transporter, partial [Terriglobales bacterium]|nr:GerAB/ArcD/ProY family transporter [Terriglobales bacterium]